MRDPGLLFSTMLVASLSTSAESAGRDRVSARTASSDSAGEVLHDNGEPDGSNAYPNTLLNCIGVRRNLLDDFEVPSCEVWRATGMRHLHLIRQLVGATEIEISLRADADGEPGEILHDLLITNLTDTFTGRVLFERFEFEASAEFEPVDVEPGRYWIEVAIGGGGACPNHWLVTGALRSSWCLCNVSGIHAWWRRSYSSQTSSSRTCPRTS